MDAREVNFDGIVGPTHNYAGLSPGNVASMSHGGSTSRPRDAALQGIQKMRLLMSMGLTQGILPPQPRPDVGFLRSLGFGGSDAEVLARAGEAQPRVRNAACSASSMWAANAATVSPSADTRDGRVHFTPANLVSNLHRVLEKDRTHRVLRGIFHDEEKFAVHPPLPAVPPFADEGAANHGRLAASHGEAGVELFVYGIADGDAEKGKYPARQYREASEAIVRNHRLDPGRVVFARQHRATIDRGVFHNDVIAVTNGRTLLYHEHAFADERAVVDELGEKVGDGFAPVRVDAAQLSVEEAVRTYLFNSQLLTVKDGVVLLCPTEVEEHDRARAAAESLVGRGRVTDVRYVDVRESMKNGGGPACLRLRVVLTDDELAAVPAGVIMNGARLDALETWVKVHYRETLAPGDLDDPSLIDESRAALDELAEMTGVRAFAWDG